MVICLDTRRSLGADMKKVGILNQEIQAFVFAILLLSILGYYPAKADNDYYPVNHFKGIKISLEGNSKNSMEDAELLIDLIFKCESDSENFSSVLRQIETHSRDKKEFIEIVPERNSENYPTFLPTYDKVNRFFVDLADLEVFPNPIKKSPPLIIDGKLVRFESIKGHPPWAEYLCSALGHEIIEHLNKMKNLATAESAGKKYNVDEDRKIHHYQVANPLSDEISKDYFGVERTRGEDCSRTHLDHWDQVIEIQPNRGIILHFSPDRVIFTSNGTALRRPRYRISHITYEDPFDFPGREEGSKNCKCEEKLCT